MALRHIHIRLAAAAYPVALCVMLGACSSPRPQSSRDVVVRVGTPAYKTPADTRADKAACDAASGPYPRPWYECMQQRGYEVIAFDVNGKPISLSRLEGPPYQAHAAPTMSINPSVTTTVPPPAPTVAHPTQNVPMTSGSAVVNVLVASLHANCFSSSGCMRSGLSQTSSFNSQLRVDRDQRRGLRCLASA